MIGHLLSDKARFVHRLSAQEKTVLVRAFAYLAHLDSRLYQAEIDPINTLAHKLYLDPKIIVGEAETVDIKEVLQIVENEQSKRIIIQELIELAYTDGEYSREERAGIKNVAEILGIPPMGLIKIEKWVEKGREWAQEGIDIILEGKA